MSTAIESTELYPRRLSISKVAESKDEPKVEEKVEEGSSKYLDVDGLGMVVRDDEVGDFDADESPYAEGRSNPSAPDINILEGVPWTDEMHSSRRCTGNG